MESKVELVNVIIITKELMQHKSDTIGINTKHNNSTRKQMSISNKYEIIERIGAGAYGEVFKAREVSTHKIVALKLIKRSVCTDGFPKTTIHEIILLRQFDHPNITKLIDVFTGNDRDVYLVFDYAEYDLSSLIRSRQLLTMQRIISFIRQMLLGLLVCHEKYIYHRDLKPDNILRFSDGRVVVADFSASTILEDENTLLEDTSGTPAFYSPEECMGEPYFGKPADVWAFGMTLYVMIYGRFPFFDFENENMFYFKFFEYSQQIISNEIQYPESIPISDELRDFFSHVLNKDPSKRYTMEQVLQHNWFKEYNENISFDYDYGKEEEQQINDVQES